MSSAKKMTTTASVATPVAPAASSGSSASGSKKSAASSEKKATPSDAKKAVVAEPVATPSAVATPAVATPSDVSAVEASTTTPSGAEEVLISQLAEQSAAFLGKLQQINVTIAALKTEYRALEKKWVRELKASQKMNGKRKKRAGNRAPSGFVKPTLISPELATFLEKPAGSEMARTEVTRDINKYIRANNLQDKENGRKINPDAKLAALLKIGKTDELTYFNLQKYMSPHFAKSVKTA
jgi:chromatin remodeling complex protein RSC6